MASCLELIPNGRLFMRPIQLHLLAFWRPASMDLEVVVPITQHLKSHLRWWSDPANTMKGRSLQQAHTQITIATDASKHGYGGHVGKDFIQGTWSKSQSELHINLLELEAVFLTVKHFLPVLKNKNVLIRSDSTTVCQYVNRQGGTKSPPLCYRTWDLWNFALENNMHLKAAHILGARNILADQLSRVRVRPTEWQMHKVVVQTLFQIWGTPLIDLFASKENKQTPVFCSWIPHQDALAIDALSISWEGMFAYVYPPICLIPKVLQHMEQFRCQIILIAPKWPRRHWYPDLLKFLIAHSTMSKETTSVARPVTTAQNNDQSSKSRSIQSACLATIDRSFQEKGFSNQSRKLIQASLRAIGPSWALYKGASMKSILDAADWSKESTFTQFYLRKLDVEVLKQ